MSSDEAQGAAGVTPGQILAGKYRVDRILGMGGMGVVVAAHHIHLDEKVAIKFLLPGMLANQEAVARFAREARAAVKIKSEHVARVSDVGTLDNGAPYLVMEYLEGGDLAAWIEQRGALPPEQAVEFVLQACEAIAEAHALGIVHRDLKPANLFVIRRPDGVLSVKVLDFGISKVTGASASGSDAALTRTSALMGSPLYMSPEQMQSAKGVDARSDLWALGVILYELLTGHAPFKADTMPELVLKIVMEELPPVRALRPDLPNGLDLVIRKCLEKDRERRYETVADLAVALMPFAPRRARGSVERISGVLRAVGRSTSAAGLPPSSSSPAPQETQTAAQFVRTAPGGTVGRTGLWIAMGGALMIAATIGLFLIKRSPAAVEPVSASTMVVSSAAEPAKALEATSAVAPPAGSLPNVIPADTGSATPAPPPHVAAGALVEAPAGSATRLLSRTPAAPKATAHAAMSTAAPSRKMASCDPNYYFDAQGQKHFKPECF